MADDKPKERLILKPKVFSPIVINSIDIEKDDTNSYKHAIMTDVRGKNGIFENVDFSYCVMQRGYFHKAVFRNCKFIGSRIIDSNFRSAEFFGCNFNYADFTGTRIDTDEILKNLPDEPNIRRELLQILRKNAISMGDVSSGRKFVLAEIAAKKEHLRRAWNQEEKYYREKYPGNWNRFVIGVRRFGLALDSFLWGHGEKLWKMLISISVLLFISALYSTYKFGVNAEDPTFSSVYGFFFRAFIYYTNLFLDVQGDQKIPVVLGLDWIVVLSRYLALGVLIAGLFRWLSHR